MATKKKMTFEQTMQRLEEIVQTLEQGDAPLEQSVALFFEEGTKLSAKLHEMLDTAEQKVQMVNQPAETEPEASIPQKGRETYDMDASAGCLYPAS